MVSVSQNHIFVVKTPGSEPIPGYRLLERLGRLIFAKAHVAFEQDCRPATLLAKKESLGCQVRHELRWWSNL